MNILEENKAFRVGLNKLSKSLTDQYYFLSMAEQRRSEAQEIVHSMLKLIEIDENNSHNS